MNEAHPIRSRLRELYYGVTPEALRFQGVLLAVDVLVIGFFIASQFINAQPWFWAADALIVVFLGADALAKLFALGSIRRWLLYPTTWIDLMVLATLVLPLHNWGFLRIARLWALVHRERFWNVLGGGRWDDTYIEDLGKSVVTLITFIFLAAGVAQALFLSQHPKLNNFLDAIYYVVTSLTTTGFGDITLDTGLGRVFTIGLMLAGISLFFGVAQKVVAPHKKVLACPVCSLDRHDTDARHCKSCGEPLPAPGGRGGRDA